MENMLKFPIITSYSESVLRVQFTYTYIFKRHSDDHDVNHNINNQIMVRIGKVLF